MSGHKGYAGEIGNIIVRDNGEKINALNIGAVENLASGTALIKAATKEYKEDITSAKIIFDRYLEKDPIAIKLIDQFTTDLARLYSSIAHVVDPSIFIIGGGISKSFDVFKDLLIEKYRNLVHEGMRHTEFIVAKLSEPGVVGAAMLPKSMAVKE